MRIAVLYSYAPQAGIIKGFKSLGHEVDSFFYGINKVSFKQRVEWKLFNTKNKFLTQSFNKKIQEIYFKSRIKNYNILLIVKGKKATVKTKELLKKMDKTKKILWTTDSIERVPDQLDVAKYVDKVFVQDGRDIEHIEEVEWMPLGFDPELYTKSKEKDIDILLFGNCDYKYYSKRAEYFVEASKLGKKYNIIFVGSNLNDKYKKILIENNVIISNKLPFTEFTKLISRSKVAVNIHQDDGGKAINPLFFAIPGSGTIQVSDNREYYNEWLKSEVEFYPTTTKNLNNRLINILENHKRYSLNETNSIDITNRFSFRGCAKIFLS